ncbi:hypothetical protein PYK79_39925 [Streptomyces sp. ID05-04B]|uniref:hypothetical protein n=1 Tax=Streptomyces sp. ID05-04B TaxID=3028661 RepID=UPI0029C15BA4|nr:hypothetical protein [Streptomyces sp. ID05-04B]MDX5568251.1 hypothetical protein [Streptomyces sp. ID05-04B]
MTTAFVSVFLFVHGLVHLPAWLAPAGRSEPFDPRHSWAFAAAGLPQVRALGRAAVALASATTVLCVIACAAAAVRSGGWTTAALTAAYVGLALKALWFNAWLSRGVLLDVDVIAGVLLAWPPSLY